MEKNIMAFLILLFLVEVGLFSCNETTHHGNGGADVSLEENGRTSLQETTSESRVKIEGDSLKKRFYEPYYPIQKDTSPYHKFEDLVLEKDNLTGYYLVKNVGGYGLKGEAYYERYPGILNRQIHQGNDPVELIFYNEDRTEVVKRINFDDLNPYVGKYQNLIQAEIYFEYYEVPVGDEREYYRNVKADSFYTFYFSGWTRLNGYTPITYHLIPVKDFKVLSGWETTTVIIDRQGDIIAEYQEDNCITPMMLSDDGRLLAYAYGNNIQNAYDQAPMGEYRVVDLQTGEKVLICTPEEGFRTSNLWRCNPDGSINIGYGDNDYKHEYIISDILDLNNRKRFYRKFLRTELIEAKEKYNYQSSIELLDHYFYNETTF